MTLGVGGRPQPVDHEDADTGVDFRLFSKEFFRLPHCKWLRQFGRFWGFGLGSRLFVTVVETHCSPAKAIFLRFNSDAIVHRVLQPLPVPKVLFRRLHAPMAEEKLDLLKLPARDLTEPGTRRAKIMRRQLGGELVGPATIDIQNQVFGARSSTG
jgi:hypothetical protein